MFMALGVQMQIGVIQHIQTVVTQQILLQQLIGGLEQVVQTHTLHGGEVSTLVLTKMKQTR